MGLSIHCNGRFNPDASLKSMIEEVQDIAKINSWKYFVFEENFSPENFGKDEYHKQNIYGICFSPPMCEPVWLSFLSNGRMSCPPNLQYWANTNDTERKEFLYMLSTKTQYAGMDIHKLIIQLLKYIAPKYLMDFNLTDEGKYWETGDDDLLKEIFDRYTFYIDGFSSALQSSPIQKGENLKNFITRIANQVNKKGKK